MFKIPEGLIEQQLAQAERERPAPEEGKGRFCPISLEDWLSLCREADVPHVPAEKICELLREDCLRFDVPGEHQERLRAAFQEMERARLPAHMMRFDYCSSLEIKISLSQGDWEWKPEFCGLDLDDPRAFDILFEYPRPRAPVWLRPWAQALVTDGYPVEYRAFVRDGKIKGISSYYPQRPLPEFPGHAAAVRENTEKLIQSVRAPFQWHFVPVPERLDGEGDPLHRGLHRNRGGGYSSWRAARPTRWGRTPAASAQGEISGVALEDRNQE